MAFEVSGITVIDGTRNITANTIIASGITYPTSDGTSGQVIITDGSGNLSFSSVSIDGSSYQTKADALAANNTLVALIDDRMQVSNVSTLVSTEVSALVDSAPSTLDTLNELAAALGDDPNFATTVTNSIATKLPLAGGTMTGTIAGFTSTGIDDNATSTAITIDSSENVGIGTASPAQALDVVGTIQGDSTFLLSNATTSSFLQVSTNILQFGTSSSDPVAFYANNAERMRIDSSGNVTVGGSTAGNAGSVNLTAGSPGSTVGGLQLWSTTTGSHFVQFGDTASGDGYYRGAIGYLHASDALVAYTSGSERMRIDSSGNMDLVGDFYVGPTNNIIYESGSTFNVRAAVANLTFQTNGANERMRIDSSGNVGIGTSNPLQLLHISKASADNYIRLGSNGSNDAGIYFNTGTDWTIGTDASNSNAFDLSNSSSVGGASKVVVTTGGNVGIGTTSPSGTLHVGGTASGIKGRFSNDIDQTLDLGVVAGSGSAGSVYLDNPNNGNMQFRIGNTERMRLDSSGRLGIFTSAPSSRLHVLDSSTTWAAQIHNNNGTDGSALIVRSDSTNDPIVLGVYGNGSYRMVARADGKVGIGSGASGSLSTTLEVSGDSSGVTNNITTYNASTTSTAEASVDWALERTGSAVKMRSARISSGKYGTWTTTPSTVDGYLRFLTVQGESLGERMRVDYDGLKFNGDTSAANALDDYEEGTWTPGISTGSATFYDATYTKVGRLVHLSCLLISMTDLSSTSNLQITGLPFTSNSSTFVNSVGLSRYINRGNGTIVAYMGGNSNVVNFYALSAGADYLVVRHADLNNANANYYLNITYQTT